MSQQVKSNQYLQGKECFTRMNFLYQASMLMAGNNNTLSSYYGELCRSIGKKATLRIEPNVKRNLCKRCNIALKPGVTSELSIKMKAVRRKSKQPKLQDEDCQVQQTCKICEKQKTFDVNTNYSFWLENQESVAEKLSLKTENEMQKSKNK